MIQYTRTNAANEDFRWLIVALDADLSIRNGEAQAFFTQFNTLDAIKHVIVAYDGEIAVGCGAIKEYASDTMEVKRMFVQSTQRGKGIASAVLRELELWAKELGYAKCVLETGEKQFEAVALYHKNGYTVIPNYGQYADVADSICFEKKL
ncbi:GNAT family N-acetyltransferase [Taibaiella soli]|uniref:GNAT family N-acetyltransferase n=1 Tax=Taibaiella soli TaxID=1649169 RepID=A0A2W2AY54_9BACT|nr:GNAT family N-acetyltransferase [Taibaiella soli]PZF72974.1 GNAT family N-acetyltransferase [Taibaiella soli]